MINFNGTIQTESSELNKNRAFKYGDAVFETLKIVKGNILFLEDHYFRLMSAMRIVRMQIPMSFTMEFLQAEIIKLNNAKGFASSVSSARITVYRDAEGLFAPSKNTVAYLIDVQEQTAETYQLSTQKCEIDLFKDHYVTPQLLSTLKTTNRILNVVASVFAQENDLDNCLLLNSNKHVVEAINGNIFLIKGNVVKTPPLADGCIKGVLRKQLLQLIPKIKGLELQEKTISPFELQQADELFYTNVVKGIVSVTKYRKKQFVNTKTQTILEALNKSVEEKQ